MKTSVLWFALPLLGLAGAATACPLQTTAARRPVVVADNAATSTPAQPGKASDAVAYPNSPNNSPATADKGAPVVTDKAACMAGAAPNAGCEGSPAPSTKADTSDTAKGTPTTVNAKPATP